MKKNKKLFAWMGIAILVASLSFGFVKYSEAKAQKEYELKINNEIKDISKTGKTIDAEKNDTKKLEDLKNLKSDLNKYKSGEEKDERVIGEYSKLIEKNVKYFVDKNEKSLKDAQVQDLSKAKKDEIIKSVESFEALVKTLDSEKDVVYNELDLKKSKESVNSLIESYKKKLDEIKAAEEKAKKEAEEKAKKEAEAAAAAAAAAAAQAEADAAAQASSSNESTYSGGSSYSSGGSTYNGSSSYNSGASSSNNYSSGSASGGNSSGNYSSGSASGGNSSGNYSSAPASGGSTSGGSTSGGYTSYGWSAAADGSNKVSTYETDNGQGHFEVGVNGQDIGGGWDLK